MPSDYHAQLRLHEGKTHLLTKDHFSRMSIDHLI